MKPFMQKARLECLIETIRALHASGTRYCDISTTRLAVRSEMSVGTMYAVAGSLNELLAKCLEQDILAAEKPLVEIIADYLPEELAAIVSKAV